jgi:hypothetical protein
MLLLLQRFTMHFFAGEPKEIESFRLQFYMEEQREIFLRTIIFLFEKMYGNHSILV